MNNMFDTFENNSIILILVSDFFPKSRNTRNSEWKKHNTRAHSHLGL